MPRLCTLYTAGYTSLTPEELLDTAERLHALIVDVRLKPWSRWAEKWNKTNLIEVWKDRYLHMDALGNLNYKGDMGKGVIMLNDVENGTTRLAVLLKTQPVIILCACKDHKTCHRTTVAQEMIDRYNAEVVHLTAKDIQSGGSTPPSLIEQLLLF